MQKALTSWFGPNDGQSALPSANDLALDANCLGYPFAEPAPPSAQCKFEREMAKFSSTFVGKNSQDRLLCEPFVREG